MLYPLTCSFLPWVLAGVRSVERGSWTRDSCHKLSQVLSKTREKVKVAVVETFGHEGGAVEVELLN